MLPIDTAAHTSRRELSPTQDCLIYSCSCFEVLYCMYVFISSIFSMNVCYRSILSSSTLSNSWCAAKKQLDFCNYF